MYYPVTKEFVRAIFRFLEDKHLTQEEFAKTVDIPVQSISRILTGKTVNLQEKTYLKITTLVPNASISHNVFPDKAELKNIIIVTLLERVAEFKTRAFLMHIDGIDIKSYFEQISDLQIIQNIVSWLNSINGEIFLDFCEKTGVFVVNDSFSKVQVSFLMFCACYGIVPPNITLHELNIVSPDKKNI